MQDYFDFVKAFLDHDKSILKVKSNAGETPLHIAATAGHFDQVNMFLDYDKSIIDLKSNKEGKRALHCAAQKGHTKIIRYFMNRGCDYQVKDINNITAADVAKDNYGRYDMTEWHSIHCLLTNGITV